MYYLSYNFQVNSESLSDLKCCCTLLRLDSFVYLLVACGYWKIFRCCSPFIVLSSSGRALKMSSTQLQRSNSDRKKTQSGISKQEAM